MGKVLIPLPRHDFDPSEAGIPWQELRRHGHDVVFATPDGAPAQADPRMLHGTGLGPWRPLLRTHPQAVRAYHAMTDDPAFQHPKRYSDVPELLFDAILLPGGHAPGMREYLESSVLQETIARCFERQLPVGAICHGVVLVARSKQRDGRSVLHGRRTTALTKSMELSAWAMTSLWLGDYYRTYPTTVEDEVIAALADRRDFLHGPLPLLRDSPQALNRGFIVQDGVYVSARWPGDAHRFASAFREQLERAVRMP